MDPRADMNGLLVSSAKAMTAASSIMVDITHGYVQDGSPVARGATSEDLVDALITSLQCVATASPHRVKDIQHKIVRAFQVASSLSPPTDTPPLIHPVGGG